MQMMHTHTQALILFFDLLFPLTPATSVATDVADPLPKGRGRNVFEFFIFFIDSFSRIA